MKNATPNPKRPPTTEYAYRKNSGMKNIDYKNYHAPDRQLTPASWFVITAFMAGVSLVSWIDNTERSRVKQSIIDCDQRIQQLERIIQNQVTGHENS
ncbi:hypothetical protein SAMN05216302_101468 [Nitrosomonas aestuarii]|uniref:Uncharacterized protein n=1 Tax=Nitrosomonas aestuarii TaxID=52441 RepID=A0A1I4C2R2_9PROT|nr:hypothetical protein [Nitrosomonas aestuarii]SFK75348.1 hypothetical protein SAMN05216302_101468 [Nitrosomonas aestuarii]